MEPLFDDVGVGKEEVEEQRGKDRSQNARGVQDVSNPALASEPAQLEDDARFAQA
jgi:hypothetical protein